MAPFYLPRCIHAQNRTPVFVRVLRCLRALMGFLSPACCRPPFAIQMSTYEASSGAGAALCSSVSLEAIVAHTRRLTQLFMAPSLEIDQFASSLHDTESEGKLFFSLKSPSHFIYTAAGTGSITSVWVTFI